MNVDSSTNARSLSMPYPNDQNNVKVPRQKDWDPFFQMIDDANRRSMDKICQIERNAYHQMIGSCARSLNSDKSKRIRALLLSIFDLYKSSEIDAKRTIKLLKRILQRYESMK